MVLLELILFVFSPIEKMSYHCVYAYSMSTTVTAVTGQNATHDSPTSVIFLIN